MNQLDCDIVRDLMPSYLDDICSESSRKAVDAHLQECTRCRDSLEVLRSTALVGEKAEKAQLDFMKKVRQHYVSENYGKVLLLFVLSLLILVISTCFFWRNSQVLILYYYVIFPFLSLSAWFLLSGHQERPVWNPLRMICGLVSILGILCGLLMEYFLCFLLRTMQDAPAGPFPFGLEPHKTGPLINACLIGMATVELLLFAFLTVDALRRNHSLGILPTLSLSGCILCLTFRLLLFSLSSLDAIYTAILRINGIILLESIAIFLLEFLAGKIRDRRRRTASDNFPGTHFL